MEATGPVKNAASAPITLTQTGVPYRVQFTLEGRAEPVKVGGQPIEILFYPSELLLNPKGPNKEDIVSDLLSGVLDLTANDAEVGRDEDVSRDITYIRLSNLDGVAYDKVVKALVEYAAWFDDHRRWPLLNKWHAFWDFNPDHMAKLRTEADTSIAGLQQLVVLLNVANYMGTKKCVHMYASVFADGLNPYTRTEDLETIIGRKRVLNDAQVAAVMEDLAAGRTKPSAATGLAVR